MEILNTETLEYWDAGNEKALPECKWQGGECVLRPIGVVWSFGIPSENEQGMRGWPGIFWKFLSSLGCGAVPSRLLLHITNLREAGYARLHASIGRLSDSNKTQSPSDILDETIKYVNRTFKILRIVYYKII